MSTGQRRLSAVIANGMVLVLLLAWWFYSRTVPKFVMPSPGGVLRVAWDLFFSPKLAVHAYISLGRVLLSTGIALVVGTALVLLARVVPVLEQFVVGRLLPLFNSFPSVGWAILAVIWFGVSDSSVIFVETAILVPFCMINVWEGLKALDAELLEMAHSFTRSPGRVLRKVTLPMLFPYLFSALRISYGVGWKVSLISELFGATSGLGYLMNLARQNFDTELIFASIVAIIILVSVVDRFVFGAIDRLLKSGR